MKYTKLAVPAGSFPIRNDMAITMFETDWLFVISWKWPCLAWAEYNDAQQSAWQPCAGLRLPDENGIFSPHMHVSSLCCSYEKLRETAGRAWPCTFVSFASFEKQKK